MPDLYERQQTLNLTIPLEVTVVGCGGVGAWVAIFAAMSGVPTLYLFDDDMLEESNFNRLPFCLSSIHRPKVEVVAEYIRGIRPDTTVIPIQEKLKDALLEIQLRISRCFIECTDSPKSQTILYKACCERERTFIRAGYDGTHITVTSSVSGWIKQDVEEEHYQIAPSWVVPTATVASLAVGKLLRYFNQEVGLDISEIGVPAATKHGRLTARCRQPAGTTRRRT